MKLWVHVRVSLHRLTVLHKMISMVAGAVVTGTDTVEARSGAIVEVGTEMMILADDTENRVIAMMTT